MLLSAVAQIKIGKENSASWVGWEQQRLHQSPMALISQGPQHCSQGKWVTLSHGGGISSNKHHWMSHKLFLSHKASRLFAFLSSLPFLIFVSWYSFPSNEAKLSVFASGHRVRGFYPLHHAPFSIMLITQIPWRIPGLQSPSGSLWSTSLGNGNGPGQFNTLSALKALSFVLLDKHNVLCVFFHIPLTFTPLSFIAMCCWQRVQQNSLLVDKVWMQQINSILDY